MIRCAFCNELVSKDERTWFMGFICHNVCRAKRDSLFALRLEEENRVRKRGETRTFK